jgi:hypothetical protein
VWSSEGNRGLEELPLGVSSGTEAEADEDVAGGELLDGSESYVIMDDEGPEANENWEYEVDAELLDAPECTRS